MGSVLQESTNVLAHSRVVKDESQNTKLISEQELEMERRHLSLEAEETVVRSARINELEEQNRHLAGHLTHLRENHQRVIKGLNGEEHDTNTNMEAKLRGLVAQLAQRSMEECAMRGELEKLNGKLIHKIQKMQEAVQLFNTRQLEHELDQNQILRSVMSACGKCEDELAQQETTQELQSVTDLKHTIAMAETNFEHIRFQMERHLDNLKSTIDTSTSATASSGMSFSSDDSLAEHHTRARDLTKMAHDQLAEIRSIVKKTEGENDGGLDYSLEIAARDMAIAELLEEAADLKARLAAAMRAGTPLQSSAGGREHYRATTEEPEVSFIRSSANESGLSPLSDIDISAIDKRGRSKTPASASVAADEEDEEDENEEGIISEELSPGRDVAHRPPTEEPIVERILRRKIGEMETILLRRGDRIKQLEAENGELRQYIAHLHESGGCEQQPAPPPPTEYLHNTPRNDGERLLSHYQQVQQRRLFSGTHEATELDLSGNMTARTFLFKECERLLGARYQIIKRVCLNPDNAVYHARDLETSREVAVKVVEGPAVPGNESKELLCLQRVQGHPNVQDLVGWVVLPTTDCHAIVTEWVDDCKLDTLSDDDLRAYMHGLISAIRHVHHRGIINRDIKPDNVLWNSTTKKATLIDFDCATYFDDTKLPTKRVGTDGYFAPEIDRTDKKHCRKSYDVAVDMWSCGITLGKHIFALQNRNRTPSFRRIQDLLSRLPDLEPKHHLLMRLLEVSPLQRISASDALRHPFFEGLPPIPASVPQARLEGDRHCTPPCLSAPVISEVSPHPQIFRADEGLTGEQARLATRALFAFPSLSSTGNPSYEQKYTVVNGGKSLRRRMSVNMYASYCQYIYDHQGWKVEDMEASERPVTTHYGSPVRDFTADHLRSPPPPRRAYTPGFSTPPAGVSGMR